MSESPPFNLADNQFVRGVISRQVRKLIASSDFTAQDRNDLIQEVYVRATKSIELYDPSVGHPYPFVCTVVQRHLANILRNRSVAKRTAKRCMSLSKAIRSEEGSTTELSQVLDHRDHDRRLARERRLSDEELMALKLDLETLIAKLPPKLRDLVERRRTRTIAEIARDTGIPRSTLNDWMVQIRKHFEEAGLNIYLEI